jgi:hypothetical protein
MNMENYYILKSVNNFKLIINKINSEEKYNEYFLKRWKIDDKN